MQSCGNLFPRVDHGVLRPVDPSLDHSSPMMSWGCAVMSSKESVSAFQGKYLNLNPIRSRVRVWDVSDVHPKHSSHFLTMVADSICNYNKKRIELVSRSTNFIFQFRISMHEKNETQKKSIDTKLAEGYNLVSK